MLKHKGFTLVELMTAMTVFVIIAGFAWPSFQSLKIKIQQDQTRNTWQQLLNFSRRSAVDYQTDITFCPFDESLKACINSASPVWAIFTDANKDRNLGDNEQILRVYQPEDTLSFKFYPDNQRYLRFSDTPKGFYSGHMRGFTLCPNGKPDLAAVHFKVNIMGRVAASQSRDADGIIMRESGSATYPIIC